MNDPVIFLLGATGYVGSQFLIILGRVLPNIPVRALVRSSSNSERQAWLHGVHLNLTIIDGTLEDVNTIQDQAEKADIVINLASCDHVICAEAILSGLRKRSANKPSQPPFLLHVSGTGIISDNARGEARDAKVYSDLDLDLESLPKDNPHLEIDISVVKAGTNKEIPIRTATIFPGMIYGVSEGIQKTTAWLRAFLEFAKINGHSGTWGKGLNSINNIHVKDVASAVLTVLQAALENRAYEGAQGIYFASSQEPRASWHECMTVIGNHLYEKGIVSKPGSHPFSDEFIESIKAANLSRGIHADGWSLFGGNQFSKPERLAKLGWEPVETKKRSILDSMKDSVEAAI